MRWLWPLAFACACSSSPRPLRLDFALRSSCGLSTQAFATTCLAALQVRLLDADGTLLEDQCTNVAGRYASLDDLVTAPEALPVLTDVTARRNVTVELRAYHSFDKEPCSELSEADLLMWGASTPVDLADENLEAVTIQIECRPECDCDDITADPGRCPAALGAGICAPLEVVRCRRTCDTDTCYGTVPCSAGLCTPLPSGLCADCGGGAQCASSLCVANSSTTEQFCSERCPPLEGSRPCPPRMSCRNTGGVFTVVP